MSEAVDLDKHKEREDAVSSREDGAKNYSIFLLWLMGILIVLVIGSIVRSYINQESTDKATEAAETATAASEELEDTITEARDASVATLTELQAILKTLRENREAEENQPDLTNAAIIEALQAIARLEAEVCGGKCPEPGS